MRVRYGSERAAQVLLQIVSHVATGAKHFCVEQERHEAVAATGRQLAFRSPMTAFLDIRAFLVLELAGAAKKVLGDRIYAHDLAARVYDYWKARIAP